jgi:hypothetical protein
MYIQNIISNKFDLNWSTSFSYTSHFLPFYNLIIKIDLVISDTYFQLTKLLNYNQLSVLIVIQIPKHFLVYN